MCQDCGCAEANDLMTQRLLKKSRLTENRPTRMLEVGASVISKNSEVATVNRTFFKNSYLDVFNIMSSPGSGKTLLLEKTAQHFSERRHLSFIVGDQEGDFDTARLKKAGARVLQINTRSSCHLDAQMIADQFGSFILPKPGVLLIENIGNLVCPASFDLGEQHRVALLSTTEGEDKPLKYPTLFKVADFVVLTKADLAPVLDWNEELCRENIRQANPHARILKLSAKTGEGLGAWFDLINSVARSEFLCV